jgi:hypothetical protein
MKFAERRPRSRRTFHLEGLEERSLLSALALPGAAAIASIHAARTVVIVGEASGAIGFVNDPTGRANVAFTAPGTAVGYGRIAFNGRHLVSLIHGQTKVLAVSNGIAAVTSSRFGEIDFNYGGTEQVISRTDGMLTLKGVVTRAFGRFDGATGTVSATGTQNPKTGRLMLSFTMTLTL